MESDVIRVAIDPDLTGSGYAIGCAQLDHVGIAAVPKAVRKLEDRILHQLTAIRAALAGLYETYRADDVVVEFPRVYPTARGVPPNDLVDLAGMAAALAGGLVADGGTIALPHPRQWKGSVPKAVHHRRLAAAHPAAVPLVNACRKGSRLDAWDAVGIWYWRAGT